MREGDGKGESEGGKCTAAADCAKGRKGRSDGGGD